MSYTFLTRISGVGFPNIRLLIDPIGLTADLDAVGGTVDIGNVGALNVNVAAGAGPKIVTIGNTDGGTNTAIVGYGGVVIASGTGVLTLGSLGQDHHTLMGSLIGVSALTIRAGTGYVTVTSPEFDLQPYGAGAGQTQALTFAGLAGNFRVGFKAPDVIAGNVTWTLPAADGTAGQVLTTSGGPSHTLSWANPGTPAGGVQSILIPIPGTGSVSSTTLLPAGAVVSRCALQIGTVFTAGSIEVGQAGSLALFQATTDNDPTKQALYDAPQVTSAVSATAVVVTLAGAAGGGVGNYVYIEYSVPQP
jgi:hypothetical protein